MHSIKQIYTFHSVQTNANASTAHPDGTCALNQALLSVASLTWQQQQWCSNNNGRWRRGDVISSGKWIKVFKVFLPVASVVCGVRKGLFGLAWEAGETPVSLSQDLPVRVCPSFLLFRVEPRAVPPPFRAQLTMQGNQFAALFWFSSCFYLFIYLFL